LIIDGSPPKDELETIIRQAVTDRLGI